MTNNEAIGILAIVVETAKGRCFVTDEAISDAYAMAIKALGAQELSKNSPKLGKENGDLQPTCNQLATDTISRQASIDAVHKSYDTILDFKSDGRTIADSFEDIINALPSVQPEQRWIPVTERLPENDNEVLITVWDAEDDYVEVYKGFYQGHEWWTQWCHGCSKIKDEQCGENIVIAWMPLPEPYRGNM